MFIAECLKQEGVTKVFGQCGHTNYALIDACHRLGIEYVSFRHEQMAAHAADAGSGTPRKARAACGFVPTFQPISGREPFTGS